MTQSFVFARTPILHFGAGKISILPDLVKARGSKVLLVMGANSFRNSPFYSTLMDQWKANGIVIQEYFVTREPTPAIVDEAVKLSSPDCVVAIGGGSVLDAGKAISAMLPLGPGVKDYLEGVGHSNHPGKKVPFIAVPTTSGTGSEATKNAVISQPGENGFKRSLRHDNFVPDAAVVDPSLTIACPPLTTAASGMDAFTQLLESYVSTSANAISDALALEGLSRIAISLPLAYKDPDNIAARSDMALASYLSGITLSNAGLGLVHGFAGPIGGYFQIPHGIVCSVLMEPSNRITIRKIRKSGSHSEALHKFATVGKLFLGQEGRPDGYYADYLLDLIGSWVKEFKIPRLVDYGITSQHFKKIAGATDAKNNPVALEKDEMMEVLEMA